jgi:hypothetical protein
MLFTNLKKIPVKPPRKDKGVKGSHPNQSMWHRTRTEAEKKAYSEKISAGMKRFYAQRKAEDAEKKYIRQSIGRKRFFKTDEGREEREYRKYAARQYQLSLEGEEKERILAKRSVSRKKAWDKLDPEERSEAVAKLFGRDKLAKIIELNVPRKKNFCGVVREDRMYG